MDQSFSICKHCPRTSLAAFAGQEIRPQVGGKRLWNEFSGDPFITLKKAAALMSRLQRRKDFTSAKSFRPERKGQVRALALGLRSRRERKTVTETTESQLIMTWGLCKWKSVCADLTVLSGWKRRQNSFSGSHKATRWASQQTLVLRLRVCACNTGTSWKTWLGPIQSRTLSGPTVHQRTNKL